MQLFSLLGTLWRNLSHQRRVERDLTDELRSYLQLAVDAKVKGGMNETTAPREAAVELGGIEQVKERVREVRAGHFLAERDAHFLRVSGRLKPGVTRAQLDDELSRVGPQVDDPKDGANRRYYALSHAELTMGELRAPLLVLLSAVSLLLLIACANVANLTLARSCARQNEMSIRTALGASRPRLVAQLFTESALLALLGGVAGAAIASWSLDLLRKFLTGNLPELARAQIDGRTLLFATALSAVAQ